MKQKIIKIGNSLGVTIPKKFIKNQKLKAGDEIVLEDNAAIGVLSIRTSSSSANTALTPEFKNWLEKFSVENRELLKKIAEN